jgi:HAD superfamily hydrolase (TIGR01548 family)
MNERTAMIAVVSPNNPTGAVARAGDLQRLSNAAPQAMLLVDLAYGEFADEDLMQAALALPNAVIIRTFSKAFGLAGMRVGYAVGPEANTRAMRAAGSPYPVSGLSLAAAQEALTGAPARLPRSVTRVRGERRRLADLLRELGATPSDSQANFVLAGFGDAEWVWQGLASLGIGVRRFEAGSGLEGSLRITCPGEDAAFARLSTGLWAAMRPQALLFDLDGVIADVSCSYRRAIALTAETFGILVSPDQIAAAKAEGNANNDWVLTHRLVMRAGIAATLEEVTERFELAYQGTGEIPGLQAAESLIPEAGLLERLARHIRLGLVTGRPRRDCERFLLRFGIERLFGAVVCMEDAPLKPDPAPIRLALQRLGITAAWMIGDTPDDLAAARAAGAVPIGISPPGDDPRASETALTQAGAARVLNCLSDLEEMLP